MFVRELKPAHPVELLAQIDVHHSFLDLVLRGLDGHQCLLVFGERPFNVALSLLRPCKNAACPCEAKWMIQTARGCKHVPRNRPHLTVAAAQEPDQSFHGREMKSGKQCVDVRASSRLELELH